MSDQRENDLLDCYPDLSDEDEEQESEEKKPLPGSEPHKMVKTQAASQPNNQKSVFTAPLLFGGKHFVPPPPPPGSKKSFSMPPPPPSSQHQHHYNQSGNQGQYSHSKQSFKHEFVGQRNPVQRQQRQRKNYLYVKNIPKHYNEVDKLMTFFKNEGQIKQIKVNHEESSATVRFVKEENAVKFINSKKAIFNRSFIIYSLNDKEPVLPELAKERENEEAGKIKKPIELEMRQLKEKMEAVLADKIRAILYCLNNLQTQTAREQLQKELTETIEVKTNLVRYSYQEIVAASAKENEYDWTINYVLERKGEVDKKIYTHQLQKKFGPISSLEITPANTQPQKVQEPQTEHSIKLVFVGPKQAWSFYYLKHMNRGEAKAEEVREQRKMQVQGKDLRNLFNEGIIKTPIIVSLEQTPKLKQLDELVEIHELGDVVPLPLPSEPVQQPEVDNAHQVKTQVKAQESAQKEEPV